MNLHPFQEVNDEVTYFFESLGYDVTWDFSEHTGKYWYEIFKDGCLIAQIDMGVPLRCIVQDLSGYADGKKSTSDVDYEIRGPKNKEMKELYRKVKEVNILNSERGLI